MCCVVYPPPIPRSKINTPLNASYICSQSYDTTIIFFPKKCFHSYVTGRQSNISRLEVGPYLQTYPGLQQLPVNISITYPTLMCCTCALLSLAMTT